MILDRWQTFSKRDQLAHIASEVFRAKTANNQTTYELELERAINLIDLTLEDSKWRDNPLMLLYLRNELASIYLDKNQNSLEEVIKAF
ncbi:MAG: hypothetical protein WC475_02245 [Candidatus Paceibacterota bacterium]